MSEDAKLNDKMNKDTTDIIDPSSVMKNDPTFCGSTLKQGMSDTRTAASKESFLFGSNVVENMTFRDDDINRVGRLITFYNCRFDGDININAEGCASITFKFCTFTNSVTINLKDGTNVCIDNSDGNDIFIKAHDNSITSARIHNTRLSRLSTSHIPMVYISDRLPVFVEIAYWSKVTIYDIVNGFKWSALCLNFSIGEADLSLHNVDMNNLGWIGIFESLCKIYADHGSKIDCLRVNKSSIKKLSLTDASVRILAGHNSLIGHCDMVEHAGATQSHGFPEMPMTLYKKVKLTTYTLFGKFVDEKSAIVKLEVPEHAIKHVSIGSNYKIRVSEAMPVAVLDYDGSEVRLPWRYEITSLYDPTYEYRIGRTAVPKRPFDDDNSTCASGIHGFLDIKSAVEYTG